MKKLLLGFACGMFLTGCFGGDEPADEAAKPTPAPAEAEENQNPFANVSAADFVFFSDEGGLRMEILGMPDFERVITDNAVRNVMITDATVEYEEEAEDGWQTHVINLEAYAEFMRMEGSE